MSKIKALNSQTAIRLLAEAAWIGRDSANALRGSYPVTEEKAVEYLPELRRKVEKTIKKLHSEAIGPDDMEAMFQAAKAPFLRRMTGID